ncbi:hypothetical protein ACFX16_024155 [Malus domestica]
MAPSRELVQRIHSVILKFAKALSLRFVPVYGGSGIAQQTGELKLGAAFVVCTPGRMIDILCTNAGRITNVQRVTYLVVDEADQMFDLVLDFKSIVVFKVFCHIPSPGVLGGVTLPGTAAVVPGMGLALVGH